MGTISIRSKRTRNWRQRLKKYGLTPDRYEAMFRAQEGQCAICKRDIRSFQSQYERQACIDHDHKTGKVRALLCHTCNAGLGMFYNNPEHLEKAAAYLRYHQK